MRFCVAFTTLILSVYASAAEPEKTLGRISDNIMKHGKAFDNLKELAARGPRLCGSPEELKAEQWLLERLKTYKPDKAWLQPVQVPQWIRGAKTSAQILNAEKTPLTLTALGPSVATPAEGLEAEVIEVKGLADVDKIGEGLKDKIVFFNRPLEASESNTFKAYAGAVDQRVHGASAAAKFGAKAVLVRSLSTLVDDGHPHAGFVDYTPGVTKIPAVALSTHAANVLYQQLIKDKNLRLHLTVDAELKSEVESHNVIAELRGLRFPEQIVVVGGHLDSWDLGSGAMDDGAGVVQAIEVLRSFRALKIRPERTLRVVLFTCEEIGGLGGLEYAKQVALEKTKPVFAIESDNGGFAPRGFGIQGTSAARAQVTSWLKFLKPFKVAAILDEKSDTDISPLVKLGATAAGLRVEPKVYFDYHHSALDQISVLKKSEVEAGAAAMAALAYLAGTSK